MDDLDIIYGSLRAIERQYHCGICLLESQHELLYLLPQLKSFHCTAACNHVKKHFDKRCIHTDITLAFPWAARWNSPFYKICPFGILELVAPVKMNHRVAGLLYAGAFQLRQKLQEDMLYCPPVKNYSLPGDLLYSLSDAEYQELPCMMALLAQRIASFAEAHQVLSTESRGLKEMIEEYITKNFIYSVGLGELAEQLHFSPPYLSSMIKKIFGRNYVEMVTEKRLANACMLLAESSYRVKNVSHNSGYRDLPQFYRFFRKHFGLTPAQYRTLRQSGLTHSEVLNRVQSLPPEKAK